MASADEDDEEPIIEEVFSDDEALEGDDGKDQMQDPAKKAGGVNPNERLAEGLREKDRGKEAYAKGNYEEADEAWCMARGSLKYIIEKELFKDDPDKLQEVKQLQVVINLNLAQGCLKMNKFQQAISHANKVLEVEPRNEKALYRKASALIDGSLFSEASKTLNILLEEDPTNASARQMLSDIARKAASSKKSDQKAAKKMMAGLERDPRTGLTWTEWGKKEAMDLIESVLPWNLAATYRDLRSLRWCRRRFLGKKD